MRSSTCRVLGLAAATLSLCTLDERTATLQQMATVLGTVIYHRRRNPRRYLTSLPSIIATMRWWRHFWETHYWFATSEPAFSSGARTMGTIPWLPRRVKSLPHKEW